MVVNDLSVGGATFCPDEAQSPLIVDADAVLTLPVLLQRFEAVTRRRAQEVQGLSSVKLG